MTGIDDDARRSMQLVIDTFRGFRDELLSHYGNVGHTLKSDKSQVTELDIKVENRLRDVLADAFPDYGFRGEETGVTGSTDVFWLVDPIDGTTSFIRGLPNCTNMAALIIGDQPVMSVIYNFFEDVLYTAVAGQGAYRNDVKIQVSNRTVADSFVDNLSSSTYTQLRSMLGPIGIRLLQPLGAAGRSFSLLAEGKIEGAIALNSLAGMHDKAPGALLVREAGGELITFDNESTWNIHTDNYIASTPQLAGFVREHISELKDLIKPRRSS